MNKDRELWTNFSLYVGTDVNFYLLDKADKTKFIKKEGTVISCQMNKLKIKDKATDKLYVFDKYGRSRQRYSLQKYVYLIDEEFELWQDKEVKLDLVPTPLKPNSTISFDSLRQDIERFVIEEGRTPNDIYISPATYSDLLSNINYHFYGTQLGSNVVQYMGINIHPNIYCQDNHVYFDTRPEEPQNLYTVTSVDTEQRAITLNNDGNLFLSDYEQPRMMGLSEQINAAPPLTRETLERAADIALNRSDNNGYQIPTTDWNGRVNFADRMLSDGLIETPEQYFNILNTGRLDNNEEDGSETN